MPQRKRRSGELNVRKDKLSKQNVILYFLGIIPVVAWPVDCSCLEDGLIGLVRPVRNDYANPFRIELCEDIVKLSSFCFWPMELQSASIFPQSTITGDEKNMDQPNGARLAQSTRNMPIRIRQRTRFSRRMSLSGLMVKAQKKPECTGMQWFRCR